LLAEILIMKRNINIEYGYFETEKGLSSEQIKLVKKAEEACQSAYAPYSEFKVGAAVLLDNGKIILGNNQENAAYPSGLCAERVALFAAKSIYPDAQVIQLAIVSDGDLIDKDQFLTPCGACRQVMAEVQNRQNNTFQITLKNPDGSFIVFEKVDDLLPLIFGK